MLTHLRLHNFKTFLNFDIDFTRRHLLIGKNNSGKSNLCYALRFLGKTASASLSDAASACVPGGLSEFANFSYSGTAVDLFVDCELRFDDQPIRFHYQLSIEIMQSDAPRAKVFHECLSFSDRSNDDILLLETDYETDGDSARVLNDERQIGQGSESCRVIVQTPRDSTMLSQLYDLHTNPRAMLFRRFLRSWYYYSLSPDSMRSGWREASRTGLLYADGRHLARAIFDLKNQDERRYRRMMDRVSRVDERLEAINFLVTPEGGIVPFVDLEGRSRASWAGLSDGTLRALALSHLIETADATMDVKDQAPPLTIIEEPENGLYVGQLRPMIEEFENSAPTAQFIFTTHSPYCIDLFDRDLPSITRLKREGSIATAKNLGEDAEAIHRYETEYELTVGEQHYKEMFE